MKTLGIHVAKSQLRYAVLEGSIDTPTIVDKGKLVTLDPENVPALMDWFDTQFAALLDKYKPDKVAYRLTLDPKKIQLFTSEFPLGILNLHAYKRKIPIIGYTSGSFVASKLGLEKGTNLINYCDKVFGKNPPYWDQNQKYAILVAWFELQ